LAATEIAGVGVTGMVPALVLRDDAGGVLRAAILQNDARAASEIEAMRKAIDPKDFFERTGGSINQQLIAPKLRWLQAHEPLLFAKIKRIEGSYEHIAGRLTGATYLEANWALEAGILDFYAGKIDTELLSATGLPPSAFGPVRSAPEVIGQVTAEAGAQTGLVEGTPVIAGCADHIASAFAAGAQGDGDLVLKFGGAGDILLACQQPVTDPRLFIDYHIIPGRFVVNGCTAAAGNLLNWIANTFADGERERARAAGLSIHARLDRMAATTPAGSDGLIFLPYVLGEKTPLHDPYARGTLIGLGLHHTLAHVWRAALEGIVLGFRHHLEVFSERGLTVARALACDGGAASDIWLQIAADALGIPVTRIEKHPGSCLGAAYVAGVGVGIFTGYDRITEYVAPARTFMPDTACRSIYDLAYRNFRDAYERLKGLYPRLTISSGEVLVRQEAP
jgi:xylulokinase